MADSNAEYLGQIMKALGRLEASVEAVSAKMDKFEKSHDALKSRVDDLEQDIKSWKRTATVAVTVLTMVCSAFWSVAGGEVKSWLFDRPAVTQTK